MIQLMIHILVRDYGCWFLISGKIDLCRKGKYGGPGVCLGGKFVATFSASASSGALQVRLFRSTNVVVVGGETIRSPTRGGKTGDPFPQGVENHPISRHIGKGCDPHLRVHITLRVFPSVQVFF